MEKVIFVLLFDVLFTFYCCSSRPQHISNESDSIMASKQDTVALDNNSSCDIYKLLNINDIGVRTKFTVRIDTIIQNRPCIRYCFRDGIDSLIFVVCSPDIGKPTDSPNILDIYVEANGKRKSLMFGDKKVPIFFDVDGIISENGELFYNVIRVDYLGQHICALPLIRYGCVGSFCNKGYILIVDFQKTGSFAIDAFDTFSPVVNFNACLLKEGDKNHIGFISSNFNYYSRHDSTVFDIEASIYENGHLTKTTLERYKQVSCTYFFSDNSARFTLVNNEGIESVNCSF